jgi:hypothetical protein
VRPPTGLALRATAASLLALRATAPIGRPARAYPTRAPTAPKDNNGLFSDEALTDDIAHNVVRLAVPLGNYLIGVAVGAGASAEEVIRAIGGLLPETDK